MKRLLTFFLICFSFVEYTRAEDIIDYKYWDEGKLTWDDFQDTLSLKGVPSAFNAFLRIEKTEKRDGNTRTIRPEAQACFDKRHSFADRQIQNENLLRLFQLKYDLLELNLGVVGIAADNRTRQYMDLYTEQSKKAEQETENGQNEIKLQEWEFYVTKELIENPAPSIPRISPRRFGYGFYLGLLSGRKHCRLLGSRLANQCRIRFSLCQYTSALRLFCRNSPYPSGNHSFQRTNHG